MQRFVLSRFQFFAFKTPRTRSTVGGAKRVSLSLSSPSLSLVRVFPSHKGSQPFFLIRQRRHRIFPTALSTRVNNNARKKHAREHCYLASFLLSLFFFTISPTLLNVHCRHPATPYRLPLLFSLEILLVFVPLFNEAPRLLVILLSAS